MNNQTTAGKKPAELEFHLFGRSPMGANPPLLHETHHSICSTSCPSQPIIPINLAP